jgi:hypothetical protein
MLSNCQSLARFYFFCQPAKPTINQNYHCQVIIFSLPFKYFSLSIQSQSNFLTITFSKAIRQASFTSTASIFFISITNSSAHIRSFTFTSIISSAAKGIYLCSVFLPFISQWL